MELLQVAANKPTAQMKKNTRVVPRPNRHVLYTSTCIISVVLHGLDRRTGGYN